jgi:hypothetical protein
MDNQVSGLQPQCNIYNVIETPHPQSIANLMISSTMLFSKKKKISKCQQATGTSTTNINIIAGIKKRGWWHAAFAMPVEGHS